MSLFITGHIARTAGSFRISTQYNGGYIRYFDGGAGEIVRRGIFLTGRPIRQGVYSVMSRSPTLTYFISDFPPSQEDYVLAADVVAEISRELSNLFEIERFVVFYHPWNVELSAMSPLPDERGIEYVSPVDLFDQPDEQYIRSDYDTHLSQAGSARIADSMVITLESRSRWASPAGTIAVDEAVSD